MAAITKTYQTILAHQAVTHPATVKGAVQDVSTKLAATIICFHAITEVIPNADPGSFLIQVSGANSGDEDWATAVTFTVFDGKPDDEPMTATEPIGETVLAVASTTAFVAGNKLYIQDTGVIIDSEWAQCQEIVTNTSIDLIDGLTNAKDSSDIILNNAETFAISLELTAIARLRVVFQHEGATGADVHVKAQMITGDSIG